ncbi:hypothetical protein ACQ4PT_008469 [Festuca glaucescens]
MEAAGAAAVTDSRPVLRYGAGLAPVGIRQHGRLLSRHQRYKGTDAVNGSGSLSRPPVWVVLQGDGYSWLVGVLLVQHNRFISTKRPSKRQEKPLFPPILTPPPAPPWHPLSTATPTPRTPIHSPAPSKYTKVTSRAALTAFSPNDQLHNNYHSFALFPDSVNRTSDPALVHVAATLTLTGPRSIKYVSHGRHRNHTFAQSISFVLDGYYSSASLQLCMVGTGTELATNGSSPKHYAEVALRLHVPSPSSLTDAFMTGTLDGSSDFAAKLLAYAEGDDYRYGERATCSAPVQRPATGSLRALEGNFACEALRETSYRLLDHRGGDPAKLRRMHVNRMQCGADGAVRAYMVLSNDTGSGRRGYRGRGYYHHMVNDEAMVAEGHWDSDRRMLCLRACRVARSRPSTLAVLECGIGMSFWFPAVLERSTVAGVLWSSGVNVGAGPISGGVISAFSFDDHRRNLSDVTYSYNDTMLEVAKKHYYLNISKGKRKGSFPARVTMLTTTSGFNFT